MVLKAETETTVESVTNTVNMDELTTNPEFGFCLDIGARYPIANSAILLDLRLNLGATTITEIDEDPRNKSFSITFGYEF